MKVPLVCLLNIRKQGMLLNIKNIINVRFSIYNILLLRKFMFKIQGESLVYIQMVKAVINVYFICTN